MNDPTHPDHTARALHCAVVLRVRPDECDVLHRRQLCTARFAPMFPRPRTERVQPGNLVAITAAPDGTATVLWRWYDAVVLDDEEDGVRLWEPAHGEVLAQPRARYVPGRPGTRAYLSAGLPGAGWWVAGPVTAEPRDADVELDEVERMYTEHGLWEALG